MIAATIDHERAADEVWDALVVGAGPAGALAARQAALAGNRVLLVDCKNFPRPKVCGACLNGQALTILKSVGLDELPETLGGVMLDMFDVRSSGRGVRLALPAGLAVSRMRFDAALVSQAIAAGVEFLPETLATLGGLCRGDRDECRTVSLRYGDSAPREALARVVLAADGLPHASLRSHPEFSSRVAARSPIGIGGQVTEYPAAFVPGTIFMAVGRQGYVGLVRVEEGLLNIAAALAPGFVKAAGGPAAAIAAVVEQAGLPRIPALPEADWQGTLPLTRRTRHAAARRVLLLGDAAGYVEPFTGEGMAWAFAAASATPPFIERARASWDTAVEAEWQATLERMVRRRQRWCRLLAAALRHPLAIRLLLETVSLIPSLASPIVRSLNRPPARASAVIKPPGR